MKALMTLEEVAGYLRLNKHTVYRLVKSGKLPASKVGTQWRFAAEEVRAWLEANRNVRKSNLQEEEHAD